MGKAEELATAVEALERAKGKRRKYPMELRERLVAFRSSAEIGRHPAEEHRRACRRDVHALRRSPSPAKRFRYGARERGRTSTPCGAGT